jgi:hypothetical protein
MYLAGKALDAISLDRKTLGEMVHGHSKTTDLS